MGYDTTEATRPIRSLADIEAFEREPLETRLLSWDANDWIVHGLDRDPAKIAIRYLADGDPDATPTILDYADLKRQTIAAANLFRALGVGDGDAVLFLLPTIPQLYPVMLGSLAAGVSCCVNWMLEPQHWIELIRASRAKVVVALGPTPGFEIWEKLQTIATELPADVRVLSVAMPGQVPCAAELPDSDFATACAKQPDDRLTFEQLSHGFTRAAARVGFMQTPDAPGIIQELRKRGHLREGDVVYFLSHDRIQVSGTSQMATWRKHLFRYMMRNVSPMADSLGIPPAAAVELGGSVQI